VSGVPKIPNDPEWQPVRAVFARYGLNPKNPDHWLEAIRQLALDTNVPEPPHEARFTGRPTRWNDLALWRLCERVKRIKAVSKQKQTDLQICARLVKGNREYKQMTPTALRRILVAARRVR
jgi:hypothetical protein